jgi:hypothetical protein
VASAARDFLQRLVTFEKIERAAGNAHKQARNFEFTIPLIAGRFIAA